MPERVSAEDAKAILSDFAGMFDENDTPDGFFDKMKQIAFCTRLRRRYQGV